jgi:hypothetical protein
MCEGKISQSLTQSEEKGAETAEAFFFKDTGIFAGTTPCEDGVVADATAVVADTTLLFS